MPESERSGQARRVAGGTTLSRPVLRVTVTSADGGSAALWPTPSLEPLLGRFHKDRVHSRFQPHKGRLEESRIPISFFFLISICI